MPKNTSSETPTAAAAAGAEPSDSDLLAILTGGAGTLAEKTASTDVESDETEIDSAAADAPAEDASDGATDEAAAGDASTDTDLDDAAGAGDDAAADAASDQDGEDSAGLEDEDQAVRAKLPPEMQKKFDRAVANKARRIVELQAELKAAQAALETAQSTPAKPIADPSSPLAEVADEAQLETKVADARKLRRFALANPDGAFVDPKTGAVLEDVDADDPPEGAVRFSKKRIGEILAETEELIQEHAPRHRQLLQARVAADAEAVRSYPWLKNKGAVGTQAVEATLKQAPQLRQLPGIRLLLADAFVARAYRQQLAAKAKGKSAPAATAAKAPPSPAGTRPPPKTAAAAKRSAGQSEQLARTGDDPGNAALRAILNS